MLTISKRLYLPALIVLVLVFSTTACVETESVNMPGYGWDSDDTSSPPGDGSDAADDGERDTAQPDDLDVEPPADVEGDDAEDSSGVDDTDEGEDADGSQADEVDEDADDDVPPPDDGDLVAVSHTRELRGVWVATAWGINFPSRTGLSAAALRQELEDIVNVTKEAGLNAIFFQVRPEGDALYDSTLEPWSRVLTGTQGQDPGIDPLAELIDLAHAEAIEVHAWLNPYRARVSLSSELADGHMAKTWPAYAYTYGSGTWMDPGVSEVRQRLVDVVADIVERYHIDGIHFDDYFYPYPESGVPFPDGNTYAAYQQAGGTMVLEDWRRENVNEMIRQVYDTIVEIDPAVRFGVAPFGIWQPGNPPGIRGLNAWRDLYADALVWMSEGKLDYLAPQLYWPSTQTQQAYEPLLGWWLEQDGERWLFPGNYLSQLGSSSAWSVAEIQEQLRLTRASGERGMGNIWYQIKPLVENQSGIRDVFRDEFYATPALPPPLREAPSDELEPPALVLDGDYLSVSHTRPADIAAWTLYEYSGGEWLIRDVISGRSSSIAKPSVGSWAIAAAHRDGRESQAVLIE